MAGPTAPTWSGSPRRWGSSRTSCSPRRPPHDPLPPAGAQGGARPHRRRAIRAGPPGPGDAPQDRGRTPRAPAPDTRTPRHRPRRHTRGPGRRRGPAMRIQPLTRLREVREARGLTRAELARKAGLDSDTIARLEDGEYWADASDATGLAKALDVIPEDLVEPP